MTDKMKLDHMKKLTDALTRKYEKAQKELEREHNLSGRELYAVGWLVLSPQLDHLIVEGLLNMRIEGVVALLQTAESDLARKRQELLEVEAEVSQDVR